MATLEKRSGPRGTSYRLVFWGNSKRYSRTLDVTSERDAKTALANAEERLALYLNKKIEKPEGANLAVWIATDGRMANEPTSGNTLPLGELFDEYVKGNPEGHLEDTSSLNTINRMKFPKWRFKQHLRKLLNASKHPQIPVALPGLAETGQKRKLYIW